MTSRERVRKVLNPVQLSAHGMDARMLKEKFGKSLVFYGGSYDAILTPPHVPAQEVYQRTRDNISALSKDGGYLFAGISKCKILQIKKKM